MPLPVVAAAAPAAASALSTWMPAIAGGAASLLSGAFGQSSANKQMDFQADQFAHRHQTEVADLRAAGLNPILSANAGGGSPSGASASMQSNPVESALSAATQVSQMRQQNAQTALLESQARKVERETNILKKEETESGVIDEIYKDLIKVKDRIQTSPTQTMPFKFFKQGTKP